ILNSDGTTSFLPNRNIFLAALIALLLILPLMKLIAKTKKQEFAEIETPFEQEFDRALPFADYPRPQLQRDSYLCLNGEWNFSVRGQKGEEALGKILVPFPPESRLSGIKRTIKKNDLMIYTRTFTLPDGFWKERVILHFGAADQITEVFVNGCTAGRNIGGYLPFSFDITALLRPGENTLRVEISDPLDIELCYGKQRKKRGGMWYTPVSGIWQTVWLESLPKDAITHLRITPTLEGATIEVGGGATEKKLLLETESGVKEYNFTESRIKIKPEQPHLWSPEDPYLYRFTLQSGEDRVSSYFALRTVDIRERNGKSYICLNGKPYFFHGLLDQGYFSDGIYLPATAEGYKNDILKMKECGFNMLRKHIKLEPELFYYYCDVYGMIVFQDMINSGKYHFILDTAIPTVWLRRGITHRATPERKDDFYRTFTAMIRQLYNHPCVCYYTIFNEGWGQFNADQCYRDFKALDPSRIFDTTSGWFKTQESDVESDHIYFKPVKLKAVHGRPMVLSEFGGYSCRVKGHTFNLSQNTGYHFFTEDPSAFEKELIALYEREILPMIGQGLNATVLTQVSDVEDETNGLLTYDRAVLKVRPESMRKLADRLYGAFDK
ncbi:MAG: hypothetical protein IJN82_05055, partial [Clostridia bacterium]|nr:hypothetical protein [Clostridia bacterium]